MKKKATVICWISTALAALALCLTCGLPLPAGIPPMLLQWLILPLLALLTAAVLYQFGTGPIRGFAVTLALGILASMFTAIFVSHLLFDVWIRKNNAVNCGLARHVDGAAR